MKEAKTELNDLIVEKGQIISIPPKLHKYDTIHIKEKGKLKVYDHGSEWLVLSAKVIICHGRIEYSNFKRGVGTVAVNLDSGDKLEHTFVEGIGGAGGNGSGNGREQGGLGYNPHNHIGGGGGSGAYYTGVPKTNLPGINATDFRGAPSPSSNSHCYGGNGGVQTFGHGGLICIIAEKIQFSPLAKIQLRGSVGEDGTQGGTGDCYGAGQIYYWGGGGGGGGTSGGNGGVIIIKCDDVVNSPIFEVDPGKGGEGGKGGRGGRCPFHGQDGLRGEDGRLGYMNWQKSN